MEITKLTQGIIFDSANSNFKTVAILFDYKDKNKDGQDITGQRITLLKWSYNLSDYDMSKVIRIIEVYSLWELKFWVRDIFIDEKIIKLIDTMLWAEEK